jgi:hypothetical protein
VKFVVQFDVSDACVMCSLAKIGKYKERNMLGCWFRPSLVYYHKGLKPVKACREKRMQVTNGLGNGIRS